MSDLQPVRNEQGLFCVIVQAEIDLIGNVCWLERKVTTVGTNSPSNHFRATVLSHSAKYDLSIQV